MKQLDNYNSALQDVYDYFGFAEDWKVFPIDDARDFYWFLNSEEVVFFDSKEAYEEEDDAHTYSHEILIHRFYPKSIYEGAEYTAILVDTHTDGNQFLQIFDNAKKLK